MKLTGDLKSAKWIYLKGILFVLLAVMAAAIILVRVPQLEIVVLLAICVWASCRAYYFAFYVIEHYVDEDYKFSGLIDFARYVFGRPRSP